MRQDGVTGAGRGRRGQRADRRVTARGEVWRQTFLGAIAFGGASILRAHAFTSVFSGFRLAAEPYSSDRSGSSGRVTTR